MVYCCKRTTNEGKCFISSFNLKKISLSYLRKSTLLVHECKTVQRFLCQSFYDFLVIHKIHSTPLQTLTTVLSLVRQMDWLENILNVGECNSLFNTCMVNLHGITIKLHLIISNGLSPSPAPF